MFTGRTDAEAEASILWPPDVNSQLTGKAPDAGKDWRQQRKRWLDAPLSPWTRVWANFRRQWRTGKSGLLQSMGLQSQTWLHDWTTTTTLKHRWPWNSSPCCHLKSFAQLSVFHLRPSRSQCSRHYGLPSLPKAKTPLDDKAVAYLVPSARSTFPSSGFLPN